MQIKTDKKYVRRVLADLVKINSVNPSLAIGAPGESEIATYIAKELENLKLAVQRLASVPRRDSVVGVLKGSGGGKSLMLNAHIDTVGVEGMAEPFSAVVRDGKLYGRGAFDMKGAMAACIAAMKILVDNKIALRGDVVISGVADEEFTSIGMSDVIEAYPVDAAIVTEPTHLQICLAHKGFVWIEIETSGRAAHGSRFELGIDANMHMGRFLAELDHYQQTLRSSAPHALVGPPSLHAATLRGGTGISTYAASCTLEIERRTIPGETEADVMAPLQKMIDRLAAADPNFKATLKTTCVRDAFEVPRDASIVQTLAKASTAVLGKQPDFMGDTPWMDSALLAKAGVETVVMGPAGAGAHADEEWVDIASVEKLAEILAHTAMHYCK
ncbi:ArgE/DapE family deacylase [candidate division KSB1 bacterium]|nr:ArgE/DapE family deacylase [candidate division KSB1 bacterium]